MVNRFVGFGSTRLKQMDLLPFRAKLTKLPACLQEACDFVLGTVTASQRKPPFPAPRPRPTGRWLEKWPSCLPWRWQLGNLGASARRVAAERASGGGPEPVIGEFEKTAGHVCPELATHRSFRDSACKSPNVLDQATRTGGVDDTTDAIRASCLLPFCSPLLFLDGIHGVLH